MPSARTRRRRSKAAKQKREQRPKPKLWHSRKFWLLVLKVVLSVLALMGTLFTIDAYVSYRLSVASVTVLDPTNPFRTNFTISNDGYMAVRNVSVQCHVPSAFYEGQSITRDTDVLSPPLVESLAPGSKITMPCGYNSFIGFENPLIKADMTLTMSYEPKYLPFRKSKSFRFVTAKDSEGHFHWLEQPSEQP